MKPNLAQLVLTNRDLQMLLTVYHYGGCLVEHLNSLFFEGNKSPRACYARVAKLIASGYLTTLRLPPPGGVGSGKVLLLPGPNSRLVVAKMLGTPRNELDRFRVDSPVFIPHHLGICDFHVSLSIACRNSSLFTLLEFVGDRELCASPFSASDPLTKKTISFVPDGLFTLRLSGDGKEQEFLLEVDRGTVEGRRMRERFRGYLVRAKTNPSPVLFVTKDAKRADDLARYAFEEARKLKLDPTLIWITTTDQVKEKTVLEEPIWTIVGGPTKIAVTSLVKNEPVVRKARLGVVSPPLAVAVAGAVV